MRDRARAPLGGRYRPVFAGVFGLVHGAGFANYLRSLFSGSIAVPLFGFNVGIELGQLVVLALAGVALAALDRLLALLRSPEARPRCSGCAWSRCRWSSSWSPRRWPRPGGRW